MLSICIGAIAFICPTEHGTIKSNRTNYSVSNDLCLSVYDDFMPSRDDVVGFAGVSPLIRWFSTWLIFFPSFQDPFQSVQFTIPGSSNPIHVCIFRFQAINNIKNIGMACEILSLLMHDGFSSGHFFLLCSFTENPRLIQNNRITFEIYFHAKLLLSVHIFFFNMAFMTFHACLKSVHFIVIFT